MITYKEYLDEPIPITKNEWMRREDYYKKYMPGHSLRDFYEQLKRIN